MDSDKLRDGLRKWATAVTVVAAHNPTGERRTAVMTVTSFMPLSLEPPLIALALNSNSEASELLQPDNTLVSVSVLSADMQDVANLCALESDMATRLKHPSWAVHHDTGVPYLEGALLQIFGKITDIHEYGTHRLVVVEVIESLCLPSAEPDKALLYVDGNYRCL